MELLRCKFCHGEMDIVGNEYSINKKVKCRQCGFNNLETAKKEPEIIIKRRPAQ